MLTEDEIKGLKFEEGLKKLEKLVTHLDDGNLSLEESISYYEIGIKLKSHCEKLLKTAELKILKVSDQIEKRIEKLIDSKITKNLSKPKKLGRVKRLENANENYVNILKKNFPRNFNLKKMKIAIDCANGAAYKSAPYLLKSLGAKIYETGTSPNGFNINNKCGSTFPKKIQSFVIKNKAHLGIALDGDADRIILADENGKIIDGDQIIGMLATRWKRKKILKGGVVGTQMSNYGLQKYFKNNGIKFLRANVGDRYVKEKMKKNKFNLGGEQSGHIILGKFATTGDGLLVALEVLFAMRKVSLKLPTIHPLWLQIFQELYDQIVLRLD